MAMPVEAGAQSDGDGNPYIAVEAASHFDLVSDIRADMSVRGFGRLPRSNADYTTVESPALRLFEPWHSFTAGQGIELNADALATHDVFLKLIGSTQRHSDQRPEHIAWAADPH